MTEAVAVAGRSRCGDGHPHEAFAAALVLRDDARACRLARQVERCTDALPPACCRRLRFPLGTTYAEAARRTLRRAAWAALGTP